jgi:uncharacterized membrane protein
MSDYRPLDDGGFVPSGKEESRAAPAARRSDGAYVAQRPKGDDLLADSEGVGYNRKSSAAGVQETSCCCSPGVLALIAYWTLWIGALVICLTEKRSYYAVFHGAQSMILSSIYCIFAVVFACIDVYAIMPTGVSVAVLSLIWGILFVILLVIMSVFAWKNRHSGDLFQVVLIGGLAEKLADKFFSIGNSQALQ